MAGTFNNPFALTWKCQGIVIKKRELTSQKNAAWKGYVASVQTLGSTIEVQCTKEQFEGMTEGSLMLQLGDFEFREGRAQFMLRTMDNPDLSVLNAGTFNNPFALTWKCQGVVIKKRELTSQKNAAWKGYVASVQTLGSTIEVQCSKEQFEELSEGSLILLRGDFEFREGRAQFMCRTIDNPDLSALMAGSGNVAPVESRL